MHVVTFAQTVFLSLDPDYEEQVGSKATSRVNNLYKA